MAGKKLLAFVLTFCLLYSTVDSGKDRGKKKRTKDKETTDRDTATITNRDEGRHSIQVF